MKNSIDSSREKRQYPRYAVDLGSFGVFRQDNSVRPGLITDLSKGGLAFFYCEGENWPVGMNEPHTLFGIEFNVEKVYMETVMDHEVEDKSHPIYRLLITKDTTSHKIRRRGVKFHALTSEQQQNLDDLIKEFQAYQAYARQQSERDSNATG